MYLFMIDDVFDMLIMLYNFLVCIGIEIGDGIFEMLFEWKNFVVMKESIGDIVYLYYLLMYFSGWFVVSCGMDD